MSWFGHADFDYGNTRLRALRGELLRDSDYERLLGEDIHGLVAALDGTRYALDVDLAPPIDGVRSLHAAIRGRFGRSLEQMRSFYAGGARGLIDALLSRFDVHNVIAVLRARSRPGTTAEETLAALTPVGWLTEPVAREILRPRELAGVVDLLARRTPDRGQAGVLRSAFGEYQRTDSVAGLERVVLGDHAAHLATTLGQVGPSGAALRRFVQRETDRHNLLVTLRLRDAIASGAADTPAPPETLLAGGSIPPGAFTAAVGDPTPSAILALVGSGERAAWSSALERWATTGDLSTLHRTLERRAIAETTGLFLTGDPLAVDIPLAATVALQVEARNLRLLGEAAVRGIAVEHVRSELVWSEARA